MQTGHVIGKIFRDEAVELGNRQFADCRFERCAIVYDGGEPCFDSCVFENCLVQFTGPAGRALGQLRAFWNIPGGHNMVGGIFAELTGVPDAAERLLR